MYFNGREIQSYELELNGTEIELIEIDIGAGDVIDAVFHDLNGIESEMVKKYKGSWGEFTGDQLIEIHGSLTEYLKCEWEFEPEAEEPEVKKGYEVGMVLRMTKDNAYHITGKKGSLFEVVEVLGKARDEVILKLLDSGGDNYKTIWHLPVFEEKEEHGFELVEEIVVLNSVENASTQELLAEIQKRLGE